MGVVKGERKAAEQASMLWLNFKAEATAGICSDGHLLWDDHRRRDSHSQTSEWNVVIL
jgi:hypothetical protein